MKPRFPWLTVVVAALVVAVHRLPNAANWLQFDRAALGRGELWRLLTAHLTHFDGNHLAWDTAVWVIFGAVCERQSRSALALGLALGCVGITTALWCLQPHFEIYRGLSGLDCVIIGQLTAALMRNDERAAQMAGAVTLVGFALKCGYELIAARPFFASGAGYIPVPLAHLVGLATGVMTAFACLGRTSRTSGAEITTGSNPA